MLHRNFVFVFLLMSLSIIINSCECVVQNCAGAFMFRVLDKQTQKDLVYGTNPIYSKDSVFLVRYPGDTSNRASFPTEGKFLADLVAPVDTLFFAFRQPIMIHWC